MGRRQKYASNIMEYVKIRLETINNKSQIAREIKKAFKLEDDIELIRRNISHYALNNGIQARTASIKRLFFDIETSYYIGWFWQPHWKTRIGAHQIIEPKKIICICYKWQDEDTVHHVKWDAKQDDAKLLKKFVKVLGEADEIVGHNIDKFDIKEFRTRCISAGVLMFPKYRTLDTCTKARKYFNFPSNRLDDIGNFLNVGRKIDVDHSLWDKIIQNKCKKSLHKMIKYCEQDVLLTEEVFTALMPYIDHNTNHAVKLGKDKWYCPECASGKVELSHTDTTKMGYIKRHMKCNECKKFFHISNRTYLRYLRETYEG